MAIDACEQLGSRRRRQGPGWKARWPAQMWRFYVSTAVLLGLVAASQLWRGERKVGHFRRDEVGSRNDEAGCRLVHQVPAADQCAFVRAHCHDEAAGLLPYLAFYYCSALRLGVPLQPLALALLVAWLGLLFTTIGIAASDFFSVNLGTIAAVLGLSESLAGVTFLAFGNGSPDVFSTFAAMASNSGSMAVGELIGAAGFITAVVAGSMALVREFRVSRRTFVRDIAFFIVAIVFAMCFLADGRLLLWECCAMIGFYVFYVVTVVGWHWVAKRRKEQRAREAAARAHFYYSRVPGGQADDDELAPYRDDPESGAGGPEDGTGSGAEDDTPFGARRPQPPEISVLDRGPRIEINSVDGSGLHESTTARRHSPPDDDDDDRRRHLSAEVTSSMRVNRPRGRRNTTMVTPIRPSLLGALEFRSVLASLQKSGTLHLAPIVPRRHNSNGSGGGGASTGFHVSALHAIGEGAGDGTGDGAALWHRLGGLAVRPASRGRALSSGDIPRNRPDDDRIASAPATTQMGAIDSAGRGSSIGAIDSAGRGTSIGAIDSAGRGISMAGDLLTVSPGTLSAASTTPARTPLPTTTLPSLPDPADSVFSLPGPAVPPPAQRPLPSSSGLHLHIPGPSSSQASRSPRSPLSPLSMPTSSPSLSPFPGYAEVPASPVAGGFRRTSFGEFGTPSRTSSFGLGAQFDPHHPVFPGLDDNGRGKPVRWWPYNVLPPPQTIAYTLFPTLQGWHEKSIWDKFVSLISVPTVFLLVMTLPVVEMPPEEEEVVGITEQGAAQAGGYHDEETLVTSETQPAGEGPVETNTASARERLLSTPKTAAAETLVPMPPLTASEAAATTASLADGRGGDGNGGWSRWLVALQLFAGPQFAVFVLWTNMQSDEGTETEKAESHFGQLLRMALWTLLGSLAMLGVLLATTSAERRPRYHSLLCFLGFVISVAWISTVAGEVVGVLKAIGVIAGISEAILGLTIFAVGNSLGDLVADITVARLGYPVMALSACFGGPMLNILLGVGIGGAWMTVKAANHHERNHPGEPRHYKPYHIHVGGTLLVSAATVLVTLLVLLVAVPLNQWVLSRRIGLVLIGIWTVSTVVNVILEVTGVSS